MQILLQSKDELNADFASNAEINTVSYFSNLDSLSLHLNDHNNIWFTAKLK